MDRSNNRLKFTTAYLSSVFVISCSFLGFEWTDSTAWKAYKSFMTIINTIWVILCIKFNFLCPLVKYFIFCVIESKLIQFTIRFKAVCKSSESRKKKRFNFHDKNSLLINSFGVDLKGTFMIHRQLTSFPQFFFSFFKFRFCRKERQICEISLYLF